MASGVTIKSVCLIFAALALSNLTLTPVVRAQYFPDESEHSGKIVGKILGADGKTAITGARVLAYHLSAEKLFTSEPTTGGSFKLLGLPYGYFDIAVEAPNGNLFVASRVINLPPTGKADVILTLVPYPASKAHLARRYPGRDQEPTGVAEMRSKPRGREFWRTPKGVAILSGLGGVALLAIAASSDDEIVSTQVDPLP